MTQQLLIYILAINLVTLVLSIIDKALVVRGICQMPDKLFLGLSWIGGCAGSKIAQIAIGHRTFRYGFTVNLNLIIAFQFSVVLAVWAYQATSNRQNQDVSVLRSWMGQDEKPQAPRRFGPGSK